MAEAQEDTSADTGTRAWLDALRTDPANADVATRSLETERVATDLELDDGLRLVASVDPFLRAEIVTATAVDKHAGRTVGQLCRGLGQLFELSLPGQWAPGEQLPPEQGEALRRMLLAVVNDYRLVVVRLAAQLAELRLARNASAERQRLLARDTREIFAPLANRLGIWQLKWELEDYAFRYLEPDEYRAIAQALSERREARERYIADVTAEIRRLLDEAGLRADVSGRPKHIFSIWKKMKRKQVSLDQLFDVRAVRIMVDSVTDCYTALGIVHNRWPYIREEFDDYIANPKGNNYRSLHTAVFGPGGHALEIQIRTHDMHAQAELGVAAHWRYKEGGAGNAAFEQKIAWLRTLLEGDEQAGNADMLEALSEGVFDDRVYAITPRGDIVDLPAGATPLDFAYHVHTEIGHRCKGARVNGRIVTLTYRLQNGDRVEIITGKVPQPSRDWLSPREGFLASARNRTKVRAWFRQQDRDLNRKQGREHLERELQRLNIRDLAVATLAERMGFASVDDLCVALGVGDITTGAVFNAVQQLTLPAGDRTPKPRRRRHKPSGAGAVLIEGAESVLTQFARCCNPVPPESIRGYITQGRGVSVHRAGCTALQRLAAKHPERVLSASWRGDEAARYPVTLRIEAADRNGLLKDLLGVLSDEEVRILGNDSRVSPRTLRAAITLRAEVAGLDTLARVMSRLSQVSGVDRVTRAS